MSEDNYFDEVYDYNIEDTLFFTNHEEFLYSPDSNARTDLLLSLIEELGYTPVFYLTGGFVRAKVIKDNDND